MQSSGSFMSRYQSGFIAVVIVIALGLAASAQNRATSRSIAQSSISGTVRTIDDHPVPNARVEVREINSGQVTASGYTNNVGAFELGNLRRGTYEVVATSGVVEARERVFVDEGFASVSLRLPQAANSEAGNRDTVSVAQMKVPGKARDALKKAREYMQKQKLDDSAKYVAKALEIYPQFAEALALRGLLKIDAKHLDDAIADLQQAIQNDPSYGFAYILMGAAYNLQTRFDDAVRTLDRGIGLSPSSWQGYFELGKALLGKSNLDLALRQLNKAEDLAPKEYAPLHLVKAHVYLTMKNYSEAIAELELYLDRDPKGPESVRARETLDQTRAFIANMKK